MDKELIAMCDCPEIQDKWEPKVGDMYLVHLNGSIHPITYDQLDKVKTVEFYRGCRTFIPRIEDVLKWLGDRLKLLEWLPTIQYFQVIDIHGYDFTAYTTIEALLKAYMHLEHNKTWNGEIWV